MLFRAGLASVRQSLHCVCCCLCLLEHVLGQTQAGAVIRVFYVSLQCAECSHRKCILHHPMSTQSLRSNSVERERH